MANKKPRKLTGFHFQPFSAKQLKVLNWWADDSPVKDRRMLIADGSIRAGKEQPLDAILYTPNGKKTMGDIKVGDYVIDKQGKPTQVIGVFPQGRKRVYRVEFDDGSVTECGAEHLWAYSTIECITSGSETLFTTTLEKLRQDLRKFDFEGSKVELRYRFPICDAVQFMERTVKLDPNTFGIFISECDNITDEIREEIKSYKINSIDVRRKFIAGLINASKETEYRRTIKYKNKDILLLEDVVFILRSLGLYVEYFRSNDFCIIHPDKELAELIFQQNRENIEVDPHCKWKKLKSIKAAGMKECQCIYVANPEHLYLTDDFIVTHNTVAITLSFILYVMKNFNYQNAAIAGKSVGAVRRNILASLQSMLIALGFEWIEHRSENYIEIIKGDVVNSFYLFGLKDATAASHIQGLTLCSCFVDGKTSVVVTKHLYISNNYITSLI